MSRREKAALLWWSFWPVVVGAAFFSLFNAVGAGYFDHFRVDLGSPTFPPPRQTTFLMYFNLFCGIAAAFMAVGLARLASLEGRAERFIAWWQGTSDRSWLWIGSLLGVAIPAFIRYFILSDAPLTDDESAYYFASQLLSQGHLYVPSYPGKLFYDRAFMVNDGKFYAQYFLGWPALMVPGTLLGFPGYMNAIYSGLTVPAVFLVLRRLAGSTWAKVGVLLYLCSPMLMIASATEMSHTTGIAAMAWMCWCMLRSRDKDGPLWSHMGVTFLFSVAFFIRPSSALGVGAPVLLYWLYSLKDLPSRRRWTALLAAAVPAVVLGGLFLVVNTLQNGGPMITSYQREFDYARENHYRFAHWNKRFITRVPHFRFDDPPSMVAARTGFAVLRLNLTLFGWPLSLLFVFFAGMRRMGWLFWSSILLFLGIHYYIFEPGIDSFGVAHYHETGWLLMILSVLGLRQLTEFFAVFEAATRSFGHELRRLYLAYLPGGALLAMLMIGLFAYLPVSLGALARMAEGINTPASVAAANNVHNAVVFAPRVFTRTCSSTPARHFVFWRPNNDPQLKNDILWVNHLTVNRDKKFMANFPTRTAYEMVWAQGCQLLFLPLEGLLPSAVPDARGFTDEANEADLEDARHNQNTAVFSANLGAPEAGKAPDASKEPDIERFDPFH